MLAILKKEINSFFASPIGYLVIALFLLLNGLFLWVFKGDFNILDNGFADLTTFFTLAPWILIFLVPAITMRSFCDEKKQGTLELLLTKPVSQIQIVLGKYLGSLLLIVMALLPTLLYAYSIYKLGNPEGNLDVGSTLGSYFGLLFLAAAYTAIGIFSSTLTDNQIVAFISAVFLCFIFYFGFEGLSSLNLFGDTVYLEKLGMENHFKSMSRGVLDTRDLLYFLSIIAIFVLLTAKRIQTKNINKKDIIGLSTFVIGLLVLNVFAQSIYKRFDLTQDNRYTLSQAALNTVAEVDSPLIVDVFLEGDFPSEFRRLKEETRQILEEFALYNSDVTFNFINPVADEATRDQNIQQLAQRGLQPFQLSIKESGKSSQELIFPWALASYNEQTVKIPLLKNNIGATDQERVNNSIQHLEYAFAEAFKKLTTTKEKKIAILKGNGELEDIYIADFLKTLKEHYNIAPFTMDSVANAPEKTLKQLEGYDLVIAAKPTVPFSEEEKYVLDQYTMNGGKSLWLTESVIMDKDSLLNETGRAIAVMRDNNLNDFFFKYGVRINPVLVKDMYSAPITLAIGEGNNTQFQPLQWPYSPLAANNPNHPITNNINLVKFDFASQIDTLKNSVDKTILLRSSSLTQLEGVPREISLEIVTQEPNPETFNKGHQTLAVLLEGEFTSVYNNRVKPLKLSEDKTTSVPTKMIVVADGDVIKNDVVRNQPQELGFDFFTKRNFGNKEFLENAVNYLLEDDGLINIRTKEIDLAFLDPQKIAEQKTKWQLINLVLPLLLLAIFGLGFNYARKRKYT
ncbi:gliding motility-associated ABC transporter substrate-binding protein GldG [Mangrovimonas sp. YM274]|uniref:gliding motility-associated ABC transporter substrate-binding protein GldG n=1 Tax=Mangrovimonas sp. YM274 TaxID=3070660 RepID=UPI0027DBEEDE|nr:gliding motility-associated ABC transporter substrate-binding protein GldG [Mangrovimonas sp. YM274]WMI70335.1 gliding motility-associated ABC transporter substrate-binding protein GldG [Mangrovimonas sp. YM274]